MLKYEEQTGKIINVVSVKKCREIPALPVYMPLEENIFYSEIHDSEEKIGLSGSKCN
ncbi:hypothetical protein [Treponema sp. C6A8]|uniref:hypothetical protein n=1 Tax=Treponema sp. C6A8 TaxID=1410609 RepID=UPI000AF3A92C|nr:hypothetical protein [Treponema sp. C6A8]